MDLRRILYDSDDDSDIDAVDNQQVNFMRPVQNSFHSNRNLETDAGSSSGSSNHHRNISCWVFGYGSLCWNPGFTYTKCITGYIRGYTRRFWQGSIAHRGTPNKPGRVATLIAEKEGITWGCAYKITGETALEYLNQRECALGGYITVDCKFFPRIATCDTEFCGEAFQVLVYIATEQNSLWMGESPIKNLAEDVCQSQGSSGHNVEYVLRLAEFMREEIPNEYDDHLFELEYHILETLAKDNISIESVMGIPPQRIRRDSHTDRQRPTTFEFTSRVRDKRLRCLNV